jgi:hypothetical protein
VRISLANIPAACPTPQPHLPACNQQSKIQNQESLLLHPSSFILHPFFRPQPLIIEY